MKILKKFSIIMVFFLFTMGLGQTAFAASKTLRVGSGTVNNTGTTDASREVLLDLMLEGGFNDVNGVVFTLTYDKDVFEFVGLVKKDKDIENGVGYTETNPMPSDTDTILKTIYYQANNKADNGVVLIAAAAANFFTANTDTYVPFKAKFRVKQGAGQGKYDIGVQKTVIGPDTAKNAGYNEPTPIPVATGLAPTADPTTAQNFEVALAGGTLTVGGSYKVSGTVVYADDENADDAVVSLYTSINANYLFVNSTAVKNGAFSFAGVGNGDYKVKVSASRPGFSKNKEAAFTVDKADKDLGALELASHSAVKGKITLKGGAAIPGMTVLIKDEAGKEIGRVAADKNGNYVTFPIPAVNNYTFWAVYGNQAPFEITPGEDFEWDLALGSVSGSIKGLGKDQTVEVSISSGTTQLDAYAQVTGDSEGTDKAYEIKYLLPGTDYVVAVVGQGVSPTFYKNASTLDDATQISVTADNDTALDPFVFNAADVKKISGNVKIGGNNAVGKTVYASNRNLDDYKIYSALTDKDGNFTIQVDKDEYYVYVKHKGSEYYFKTAGETVQLFTAAVKVNASANDKTGIDLKVVVSTSSVDGVLTLKREDGPKLANVLVEARSKDTDAANITRTNGEGYYLIGNLNEGGHAVTVFPPNPYAPISEDVTLKIDEKVTKNFIVGKNFTLTGTVVAETAENPPIQGAWVTIFVKDSGAMLRPSVKTDAEGVFTLADIPTGIYTLSVYHQDYEDKDTGVTVDKDLDVQVMLAAGAAVDGTVTDNPGGDSFVDKANVRIVPPGSAYSLSTKTGIDGKYQFKGLLTDTVHLIGAKKGTEYNDYTNDVATGGVGTTTTENIRLTKPTTSWKFEGTVNEGGAGVAGAYVLLDSSTTGYGKAARTDAAGKFAFDNVPTGDDYTLTVLPSTEQPLIITSGINIDKDISGQSVVVPDLVTLKGVITLSDGVAGKYIFVSAINQSDASAPMQAVKAVDQGDGNYSYTVTVKSGDLYKIGAQDLMGDYPVKYYGSDGSFANSTPVAGGDDVSMDISL